jgi:hypothetical protein
VGFVLGVYIEDYQKYVFVSVLYDHYQWWVGEVCSNGHGGGERGCCRCLYWKGLPTRSLVFFERQICAHRRKLSEELLTSHILEVHPGITK